ncbi:MAG: hypothetical protein IPO54_09080 [Micavibrio sp.]|nr:hypothetical protein [Micavibrio sp.]
MYVVTENLTCDKCFTPNGGGIDIIDDSGNSILPNVGEAHFLVMSYGKNSGGAYAKSGDRFACITGNIENDNCNYDDSATPDATYRLSINSSAKTAAEFDDVIDYFSQMKFRLANVHETTTGYPSKSFGRQCRGPEER